MLDKKKSWKKSDVFNTVWKTLLDFFTFNKSMYYYNNTKVKWHYPTLLHLNYIMYYYNYSQQLAKLFLPEFKLHNVLLQSRSHLPLVNSSIFLYNLSNIIFSAFLYFYFSVITKSLFLLNFIYLSNLKHF